MEEWHEPYQVCGKCVDADDWVSDEWFGGNSCGWWGYFGQGVPDKYFLKKVYDEEHGFQVLCSWCL